MLMLCHASEKDESLAEDGRLGIEEEVCGRDAARQGGFFIWRWR
jgi:hypothetical protein